MIATIRKLRNSKAGTTLVESTVSLFLMASFAGGACRLAASTKEVSDSARANYQAVNIAKNRIERMRTMEFGQLALLEEDQVRVNSSGAPDGKGQFRRSTSFMQISTEVTEVTVTVELENRVTLDFDTQTELRTCLTRFETTTN